MKNPGWMCDFCPSCVHGGTPDPSHESGPQRDSPAKTGEEQGVYDMEMKIPNEKTK